MSKNPVAQQFDSLVDNYVNITTKQHAFFDSDTAYLQRYKVVLAQRLFPAPKLILDYGCGIGLLQKFIPTYFPHALISATDLSRESLLYVKANYPCVSILNCDAALAQKFDLIFVSCVMHHVPPSEQQYLVNHLISALNPGGTLLFFEHNPWNPVTQHMVNTCPIDEDAVLLRRSWLYQLITSCSIDTHCQSGYTLFFPGFLSKLRPLENLLRWLPLGGQYYVMATKLK